MEKSRVLANSAMHANPPLAVVTSCRKDPVSLRTGHTKPSSAKKGRASFTGPWNITFLQQAAP